MSAIIPEFNVMRALGIFIILAHHLPDYCFNYYNLSYLGINIDISLLNDLNRYFALGIFIFISGYLLNEKT
jgi:peptidoglycan/LPS O-acetylase OafA/YrhL